jgi:hypothetical protein
MEEGEWVRRKPQVSLGSASVGLRQKDVCSLAARLSSAKQRSSEQQNSLWRRGAWRRESGCDANRRSPSEARRSACGRRMSAAWLLG